MNVLIRYMEGHRHPVNRACHAVAIPALALAAAQTAFQWEFDWHTLGLAVGGLALLVAGHRAEGNQPVVWTMVLQAARRIPRRGAARVA
jgi:hypothetical protein